MAKLIRFYVEAIESTDLVRWERQLSRIYGGFTKHSTEGGYVNADGYLLFEKSYVLEVVAYEKLSIKAADMMAESLRDICRQESVLLTIQDIEARLI